MSEMEKLEGALRFIRGKTGFRPKAAVILGSGLGGYAGQMKIECEIPYGEIPGFPVSTVKGHDGRFIFGYVGETPVAAMKGRVHYYEGYNMEEVVRPVRMLGMLGAERLLVTNAAGGTTKDGGMKSGRRLRGAVSRSGKGSTSRRPGPATRPRPKSGCSAAGGPTPSG